MGIKHPVDRQNEIILTQYNMNTKKDRAQGVVGYDICDIRPVEMKQMVEMCSRVKHILDNHQNKDAKKEYLSDDDMKKIWAILSVLTRDSELSTRPSEFEIFLEELNAKPAV